MPGIRRVLTLLPALAVPMAAACGGDASAPVMEVVRDTVGDTVVVRTVSGSAWGEPVHLVPEVSIGVLEGDEVYMFGNLRALEVLDDGTILALDSQVPALRVYDTDGTYRTTVGRGGGGPGEFGQPDGILVLSDGRIVVRDVGNARLQVFGPDLEPLDTWPVISGNFSTSTPPSVGPGDTIYTPVVDTRMDIRNWRTGLQRVTPDGRIVDTLMVPDADYAPPMLEARHETEAGSNVSRNSVPYSPGESWAFHPDGYFVHGVATEYQIDLLRPGSPLRIERVAEPVPVKSGEKAEVKAQTVRNMQGTDPNWRWSGADIPDTKPLFGRIFVGKDGRIWVQVPQPGVEGEDPDYDPTDPDDVEDRWSEPVAFDVFQGDGTYLGRVHAPDDFATWPTPVFDGDKVWAVTRDELGVQRIVRFRVGHPET